VPPRSGWFSKAARFQAARTSVSEQGQVSPRSAKASRGVYGDGRRLAGPTRFGGGGTTLPSCISMRLRSNLSSSASMNETSSSREPSIRRHQAARAFSDARPERPQADVPRSAVNPHRLEENRRQRRATTLMCALAMAALVGRSGVTLLPSDEHVDGLHRKENIGRRAPETGVNVGTPSELKAEDTTPALDLIGCAPPRRAVRKPLLRGHEHAYFSAQRSHLGTTKGASGRAPSTGNAGIRSPACSGRPRTRRHGRGSGSAGGPARARARTR
jgi:hypothetical protein